MSTLYIMEAANLFCGDHDPTKSKHLSLSELKLPALQAMYQDHHPGGGVMQIEVEMGIQKLEPTFKLVGFDPDVLVQFGLGSKIKHVYTAYGVITDRRTGRKIEAKTIMEGRLGKAEMDAFSRGNLLSTDYAINEVTHYELWFDGTEKFAWDFFTNTWRVDGANEVSDVNQILRISGS